MTDLPDTTNLLNLEAWNATESGVLSYIKTPIQNTFFANNAALIGTALRQSIIYFAETLTSDDRFSCVLGNEFRSARTHRYHVSYPSEGKTGETTTPMEITTFAPIAFEELRSVVGITRGDFLTSFGDGDLVNFANTGKSGSQMYKTQDDVYIIKTLRDHEAKLLLQTLPGLFLRYSHSSSLMTRYVGLYSVNIRSIFSSEIHCVVMLNNLPSIVDIHELYDLKGSSIGRHSSVDLPVKRLKALKDRDLEVFYPFGIRLPHEIYRRLRITLESDIFELRKMMITDFSLMLGIYHLDEQFHNKQSDEGAVKVQPRPQLGISSFLAAMNVDRAALESRDSEERAKPDSDLTARSIRKFIMKPLHLIACPQEDTFPDCSTASSLLGIPGVTHDGHRILLYPALIDCLQSFDFFKRMQHTIQNLRDPKRGAEYSVIQPDEYEKRIIRFLFEKVFIDSKQSLEELLVAPNITEDPPLSSDDAIERNGSSDDVFNRMRDSFEIILTSEAAVLEDNNQTLVQTTETIQKISMQPLTSTTNGQIDEHTTSF